MRGKAGRLELACSLVVTACALAGAARCVAAAAPAGETEYAYRVQPRDTLIGLGRRLLKEPGNWQALQRRNAIADPRHVPVGTEILIPRDWLRQQPESAEVTAVVGTASGRDAPLRAGDILREGARLGTAAGGYVTLRLADGSIVTLNPGSSLELERLQRYEGTGQRDTGLKLDAGSVETRVQPQGDAGRFRIRTPVAISAVRGTEFRRAFDAPAAIDRTEVMGGAVAVAAGASGVVLPAGFGTLSDAASGVRPPVRLLPPPDLVALPARIDEDAVQVGFASVPGAQGYRAQVASDAEFSAVAAEGFSATPDLSFQGLPDGHFWLRVRSRDALGLEGPDAVHAFDRHRLPAPPLANEPRADAFVTGAGAVFRWAAVGNATGYRFQLARDPAFGAGIVERGPLGDHEVLLDAVPPGTYYWRVAAIDAAGAQGSWSAAQRYRQKRPPGTIEQVVVGKRTIELAWTGEPGEHYVVQMSRDRDFSHVADEQQVDAARASLPRHGSGTYFLRVQATDDDGYRGPYSAPRQVIVQPPWWVWSAPALLLLSLL